VLIPKFNFSPGGELLFTAFFILGLPLQSNLASLYISIFLLPKNVTT